MDNAAELINLARERFGVLSAADEKLLSAVARGENADFSSDSNEDNDPAQAQDWSEERAFNAYRIAWLCTDAPASALVTHRGIRLELARIDENLDLDWAKVPFPLIFRRCAFSGPISLRFAKVPWLAFDGTHTHALSADGLKVEGAVFLGDGFKAEGEVRLLGATIGGSLSCIGGTFTNPELDVLHWPLSPYAVLGLANGLEDLRIVERGELLRDLRLLLQEGEPGCVDDESLPGPGGTTARIAKLEHGGGLSFYAKSLDDHLTGGRYDAERTGHGRNHALHFIVGVGFVHRMRRPNRSHRLLGGCVCPPHRKQLLVAT